MPIDDSIPMGADLEGPESSAPGRVARRAADERSRLRSLVRTIEGEIVPRLLMGSRTLGAVHARTGSARPARAPAPEPADVDELARILVTHGASMACEFVAAVHHRGTPYDRICLDLLAPAAQRLVDGWERQDLSYPQLGNGLEALHAVVLEVSNAARSDRPVSAGV
jgi:MerR family transcriptional regulator, light-induced transcriptional regulator